MNLVTHAGDGAFSGVDVYSIKNDNLIAVKKVIALPDGSPDPVASEHLRSEATIMQSLDHHSIPRVYFYSELPYPSLGMDYISGPTLEDLVQLEYISLYRIKNIFRQLFCVLDYIHSVGIIHADVKPQNIILGPGDRLYLIDFGLSFKVGTKFKTIRGTPYFLPPEALVLNTGTYTDIWGAGITLFYAVSGTYPIAEDTTEDGFFSLLSTMSLDYQPLSKYPSVIEFLKTYILVFYKKRASAREILQTRWIGK